MKNVMFSLLLCVLLHTVCSKSGKSKVNVYSRDLGQWGKENTLICHVSNIPPPPVISIDLLKNGQVIQGTNQSDLVFDGDWDYYLTKHVTFTPAKGDRYSCRVTHMGKVNNYEWEPDE
ncbi:beta-2-microglobulin [Labrus bergylta]|uniref:Beta-2-microglobulin n=1 Tax=Labrus bergylta TaxID=56723 RepID=A0A3Q3GYK6_9LABR|nr:beta-2-microglobulin-like [Labrus bergylta]